MKESEALEYATKLIQQYPHIKAEALFINAVGAVLSEYPPGIVGECTDPRTGYAKKHEFLSIKALTEWLEERLAFHQALAAYKPPALPEPRKDDFSDEHRRGMIGRLQDLMHGMFDGKRDDWRRPIGPFERDDDNWNRRRAAPPPEPAE